MANAFYENHAHITQSTPYIFHKDSGGCAPHWHENVEILHFHANGTVYCDKEIYEVTRGDIVVINSDAVHSIPITAGLYYDCLIADCKFCAENEIDITDIDFSGIINDKTATELYNAVCEESDSTKKFGKAGARAALLNLIVYLCRNFSNGSADSSKGKPVKQAIKYINNRLGEHISVDDIAGHISMSKYHFCREFKKETGYTVVGYINLMRCLKAEKLLSSGEYTVSEAAEECGFDNLSYFSKTYKRVTGNLPAEHKKSIKSNKINT